MTVATVVGASRAGIGLAMLVAPSGVARSWVGADDAGTQLLVRVTGGRDVALGVGALIGVVRGKGARPWIAAGVAADLTDVAATLIAREQLPRSGRVGTTALASVGVVLGAWALRDLD